MLRAWTVRHCSAPWLHRQMTRERYPEGRQVWSLLFLMERISPKNDRCPKKNTSVHISLRNPGRTSLCDDGCDVFQGRVCCFWTVTAIEAHSRCSAACLRKEIHFCVKPTHVCVFLCVLWLVWSLFAPSMQVVFCGINFVFDYVQGSVWRFMARLARNGNFGGTGCGNFWQRKHWIVTKNAVLGLNMPDFKSSQRWRLWIKSHDSFIWTPIMSARTTLWWFNRSAGEPWSSCGLTSTVESNQIRQLFYLFDSLSCLPPWWVPMVLAL